VLPTDDARRDTEESGRNPAKEPIMSTSPYASGHLHQHSSEPPSTTDWVENVAVAFEVLTAIVVVAGILALLIII
jgi:hypothetical protein